jgi:hypothetical protein
LLRLAFRWSFVALLAVMVSATGVIVSLTVSWASS